MSVKRSYQYSTFHKLSPRFYTNIGKVLVVVLLLVSSQQLHARSWTVYLFFHAQDAYQEAQTAVKHWKNALVTDTDGEIKVCIDVFAGDRSQRVIIERGLAHECPLAPCGDPYTIIKNGCETVFKEVGSSKTALFFSGHGTGILTPRYDAERMRWYFEPDEGQSACSRYSALKYEAFCKKIEYIMEGKSVLLSPNENGLLTIDQMRTLFDSLIPKVLTKKIDLIGFDACYMALFEVVYELHQYCNYVIASQECEDKEGWNYHEIGQLLRTHTEPYLSARHIAIRHDRIQHQRGLDRYSLSVFDSQHVPAMAAALDDLCTELVQHMETNKCVIQALCAVRTRLHKMSGVPFYVDLLECVDELLIEINTLARTPQLNRLVQTLLSVRETHALMMAVSVHGPLCARLKGCSVYFPYAHIDTSYNGSFVAKHSWYSFLEAFVSDRTL